MALELWLNESHVNVKHPQVYQNRIHRSLHKTNNCSHFVCLAYFHWCFYQNTRLNLRRLFWFGPNHEKNKQNPYPQLSNLNSSENVEDSDFVKLFEDGTKLKIHSQIKQPLPFLGEVPWSILVVLKFGFSLILLVLSIIDAVSQIGLQFNGGLWSF